eukprot:s1820_g9.t1
MGISTGGWNNWRRLDELMFFSLDHLAGQSACAGFDPWKETRDLVWYVHVMDVNFFGREDFSEEEWKLVCNDNVLWIRTLWLAVQAYEANSNMEMTLEQPQDPEEWKKTPCDIHEKILGWNGFPSFLAWPETEIMAGLCGLKKISFHQGALGHGTAKPTTLLTSMAEMLPLQGLTPKGASKEWPKELADRLEMSNSLAAWAPGLKSRLAEGIQRVNVGEPPMKALSATERRQIQEWQLHVSNGHLPFRRDCAVCLERIRSHFLKDYNVLLRKTKKRSLEAPLGSPLDRDDLLDQLEKDLEARYAREREPVDLTDDQPNAPLPGDEAAPVQDTGSNQDAARPPAEQPVPDQEKPQEDVPPDQHHEDLAKKNSKDEDPWEILPHRQEDLKAAEISWWDVKDQSWKDKVADLQDVEVRNLTFAVPM